MLDIDSVYLNKNNVNLIQMFKIINLRRQNRLDKSVCYCEKHHIIPCSYFRLNNLITDNSDENIVLLTAKEHVLVHWHLFKYYLETDSNNKMYFAMLNAIHEMTNMNSQQLKSLDKLDSEILDIYEQTKKYWSDYYKNIPGCHLGKIQIRDKNGKVVYIEKNEIDSYLNNGYMTNMQYGFNQWNNMFQCWKSIGFKNTKDAYKLVIDTFKCTFSYSTMMNSFRKYIPEYQIIRKEFLQLKQSIKKKHVRINKYHKQHKKYTAADIEFVKNNTIEVIMKKFNISYSAVAHLRCRINKDDNTKSRTRYLRDINVKNQVQKFNLFSNELNRNLNVDEILYIIYNTKIKSSNKLNVSFNEITYLVNQIQNNIKGLPRILSGRTKSEIMKLRHMNNLHTSKFNIDQVAD